MIYLDNAATSFPKPERVYVEMDKCMRQYGANPGRSGHRLALEAGRALYRTRERLCMLFNIDNPMQIVFTSNATESLNLGIKGLLKYGDHVITSSMEHNSVARPLTALKEKGIDTTFIRCDFRGILDPEDIEKTIKKNTALIVVTHASNVTGTLMPIKDIGAVAKKKGIPFMVDVAQTAGVYDLDVKEMNIDMLAFPGHKGLLGPQGTGGLYISEELDVMQMKEGGTGSNSENLVQPAIAPDRYESGTPNTPGIVGLGEGVGFILDRGTAAVREHEEKLTGMLLEGFGEIDGVKIYGPKNSKLKAGVVSINILDGDSGEISYILDKSYDIATRAGLHCAPLAHRTIGTFEQGTIRFSVGVFNTREDIEAAIKAVEEIASELR
ncbi:MAG: aminotransferase class V-fold PLP-dependent enzyme [Bacillota bacterium]|jgi:cysteine desulfurase family protein|nr:aminotransferase class V-fold PLP-dependent enzyme [Bacillota bacterium]MDD3298021.1 aminotransferase class V-fold PLP-dependent enzyme [Bacillota bacterium]MDD3850052.1 aminotransferase class V-fold PLP-dependent enzyme [Bacillota bacterium]MDD4706711.1 aminotransferase class V-fold PLP-dependent enzyme [Bacillota bacterium]